MNELYLLVSAILDCSDNPTKCSKNTRRLNTYSRPILLQVKWFCIDFYSKIKILLMF